MERGISFVGGTLVRKSLIAASAALSLFPLSAPGASVDQQPKKSFPLISGNYLISLNKVCQPSLNVTYGNISGTTVVTNVTFSEATSSSGLTSGRVVATQGQTKGSGTFALTSTESEGDPVVVDNSDGGEQGTILGAGNDKGSVPFVQTATTLSITDNHGTSTYTIYYGLAKNGVAESAVFGGIDDVGCMEVGSVSPQ